ncbi:hypothetical protein JQ580_24045 [Bradyrhizobium japonicum]|uniref:hypothetical protein n=1 Tax=Bradyrhizobium japonicum TaxID=375 RepID=UPI001BAD2540|nr:hypothetical protein [Bradyrhizobium japonicum]MBR0993801.1 hypothetical protein [Bradyrhizobium japonicum]
MIYGSTILRAVAQRTGFNFKHVESTACPIVQSGAWPTDPSKAVALLLLALPLKAKPKEVAPLAASYFNLSADGYGTAGELIGRMLDSFINRAHTDFSAWAYRSRIEVYATATPAVTITTPCTDGQFIIEYATPKWRDSTVRHSNILSGKALFDIAADISMKVAA